MDAYSGPDSDKRLQRWYRRAAELKRAVEMFGRMPREGDPVQPGLVSWVKNQRRFPNLSAKQVELLEAIPGWSWDPHADCFDKRVEALADFIASTGRIPRRRSGDANERSLGEWLGRQRRSEGAGRLDSERAAKLGYALRRLH
jgi:ribosomal protein S18